MPSQVNGQLVTIKSQMLPQVAGGGGNFFIAACAAFVTMIPSADACVANAAPASPSIIAAETPNFIKVPPSPTDSKHDRSPSCAGPTQRLIHYNLISVFMTR